MVPESPGRTLAQRAHPPLPHVGPETSPRAGNGAALVAPGCYLISYRPRPASSFALFDGTLRVETRAGRSIASGDLYQRDVLADPQPPEPDPAAGIPIFPVTHYRYYLCVSQIAADGDGFRLAFDAHRLMPEFVDLLDGTLTRWLRESSLTARMTAAPAPAGFPSSEAYFVGEVTDDAGTLIGTLSMGRVSAFLRKATIEIDRVPDTVFPMDNGADVNWKTIFDGVGWDMTVIKSDSNVAEPSGESWCGAEAHAAMDVRRDRSDLDAEWRYYILVVRRIDFSGSDRERGERGFMFDGTGLPREGLMVASHWPIPPEPQWGLLQGLRLGDTVAHFRTAVHELGHAMGLSHNLADNGIMCSTDVVAERSRENSATPFPGNMQWSFAVEDEHRLRHWPDIVVRPGGTGLSLEFNNAPIDPLPSDRQRLELTPVRTPVPLGAPVRIELRLVNTGDRPAPMPQSLGQMAGNVRGHVVDPSGTLRTFAPLAVGEVGTQEVRPGATVDGSLTLCHGDHAALFPVPGRYRLMIEADWAVKGTPVVVRGTVELVVTPSVNTAQTTAARTMLATPDTTLVLALGGDHLKGGLAALAAALKSAVLRPHVAVNEAQRLAIPFGTREADLQAAAGLIAATTVMSLAELKNVVQIVNDSAGTPGAQAVARALKAWAAGYGVSDEARSLVRDLEAGG